jgi:hypothetical protein
MYAEFPHHAVECGQLRKCALQSPECPHCGRNVGLGWSRRASVSVSEQEIDFLLAQDYELTRSDDRPLDRARCPIWCWRRHEAT